MTSSPGYADCKAFCNCMHHVASSSVTPVSNVVDPPTTRTRKDEDGASSFPLNPQELMRRKVFMYLVEIPGCSTNGRIPCSMNRLFELFMASSMAEFIVTGHSPLDMRKWTLTKSSVERDMINIISIEEISTFANSFTLFILNAFSDLEI